MKEKIKPILDKIKGVWNGLTKTIKILLIAGVSVIVIGAVVLTIVLNKNANFTNKEMKSIFMHELGHALGLAHNSILTSIMHDGYTGRTIISDYDINDINTLY